MHICDTIQYVLWYITIHICKETIYVNVYYTVTSDVSNARSSEIFTGSKWIWLCWRYKNVGRLEMVSDAWLWRSLNVQHDTTYENILACVVRVLHCEKRVAIHQWNITALVCRLNLLVNNTLLNTADFQHSPRLLPDTTASPMTRRLPRPMTFHTPGLLFQNSKKIWENSCPPLSQSPNVSSWKSWKSSCRNFFSSP